MRLRATMIGSGLALALLAGTAAFAQRLRELGWIEGLLADGRDFLTGSAFTVADAYAFVVVNWSGMVGVDLAEFPKIRAFADRVRSRPAVQQAMQAEGLA